MANPFDQFDSAENRKRNPFDQFDEQLTDDATSAGLYDSLQPTSQQPENEDDIARAREIAEYEAQGGGFLSSLERGARRVGQTLTDLDGQMREVAAGAPGALSAARLGEPYDFEANKRRIADIRSGTDADLRQQQQTIGQIPQRPEMQRMMQAAAGKSLLDGAGAALQEAGKSPDKLGFITDFAGEQIPNMAATVAATMASGGLAAIGKAGQMASIASGASAGSFLSTYGSNVAEGLEKGMPLDQARAYGAKRSAIQAAVDGATGSVVPVKIGGSQIINIPTQTAIQMLGGGGGEYLAALGVDETPQMEQVLLEGLMEAIGLPGDVVAAASVRKPKSPAPIESSNRIANEARPQLEYKPETGRTIRMPDESQSGETIFAGDNMPRLPSPDQFPSDTFTVDADGNARRISQGEASRYDVDRAEAEAKAQALGVTPDIRALRHRQSQQQRAMTELFGDALPGIVEEQRAAAPAAPAPTTEDLDFNTGFGAVNNDPETHLKSLSGIVELDPAEIQTDAKGYQFKDGGDEHGVTDRLRGVKEFDPTLAGVAMVHELEDGSRFIADGHQRLGLAKRAQESGQKDVLLPARIYREKDGYTQADMRRIAAYKNIAEDSGTSVDAAKVIREGGALPPSVPQNSAKVRDALGLAKLSDEVFGGVINGVMKPSYGAIIGNTSGNAMMQQAMAGAFSRLKPSSTEQAQAMALDILRTGVNTREQASLFGSEMLADSIIFERSKILANSLNRLKNSKSLFKSLNEDAELIQSTGRNKLDRASNEARQRTDEALLDVLMKLATRTGALSDVLSKAARSVKDGKRSVSEATGDFVKEITSLSRGGGINWADGSGVGSKAKTLASDIHKGEVSKSDVIGEPVSIDANRLPDHAGDPKALRKFADQYYKQNLLGRSVSNPDIGEVQFTRKGLEKSRATSANPLKSQLIPYLPEIISSARLISTTENRAGRPGDNVKQWHWLETDADVKGIPHRLGVTVFEDDRGNKYYNLNVEISEGSKHTPDIKTDSFEPSSDMVSKNDDNVNIAMESEDQDTPSGGGFDGSLYSNAFADPRLWRKFYNDVLRPVTGMTKERSQRWKSDWEHTLGLLRQSKQSRESRGYLDGLRHFSRVAIRSEDGYLQALAKQYNSPTILAVKDMLFAEGGAGRTISQSYHEGVEQRVKTNLNKLARILEPLGHDKQQLRRLVNLIENPAQLKAGRKWDDAAIAISRLLAEERKYMVNAGLEVGEVTEGGYFPTAYNSENIINDPQKFLETATRAYEMTYGQQVNRAQAQAMAESWLHNIRLGDVNVRVDNNDFHVAGVPGAPSSLKARVFTKPARDLLREAGFTLTDPVDILQQHFTRTAPKAEFNKRFGGDRWANLKASMLNEGAAAAVPDVVNLIRSATGNTVWNISPAGRRIESFLRAWSVLEFLPRATFGSIHEASMNAVSTGSARQAFNSFSTTFKELYRSSSLDEIREIAEDLLGTGGKIASDMMLTQRMGGQIDSDFTRHITENFFRYTGLHQLTEAQRLSAVETGRWLVRQLSKDVAARGNKHRSAEFLMQDLGIAPQQAQQFAKWVMSRSEGKPSMRDLQEDSQWSQLYQTAILRHVDRTIMNPNASTRPYLAKYPIAGLAYNLQSFLYAFSKNVLVRQMRLSREAARGDKGYTMQDRINLLAPSLMMVIPLAMAGAVGELRDEIFKDPAARAKGKDPMSILGRALSRFGAFGAADPWINMIGSIRYRKDPATAMVGPLGGQLSTLFKAVGDYYINNSDNTNTAERNLAKVTYSTVLQPMMNGLFSMSPVPLVGAAGIQTASHPAVREKFISAFAGEKDEGRSKGAAAQKAPGRRRRPRRPKRPNNR